MTPCFKAFHLFLRLKLRPSWKGRYKDLPLLGEVIENHITSMTDETLVCFIESIEDTPS